MILRVDFSTLEVTVAAFLSQDKEMMREVREEVDFHKDNAIKYLGSESMRRNAKEISFQLQYGASAYAVHMTTGLPMKKVQEFFDGYFHKYSGLVRWQNENIAKASMGEPIILPNGRRFVFEKENGSIPVKKIKNYPIQSFATGAGGVVAVAMVESHKRIKKCGLKSKLILQVHDEVVFDSPKEEVEEAAEIVLQTFHDTPALLKRLYGCDFNLPLRGEAKWGKTWGDLEGQKVLDKAA